MKSLYLRLAAGNIKNNRRFYLPFLLTAVMTVACFFILCSAGLSQTLPGGQTVILVMRFGVIVVAIFSVIFLYYTNSFLIKRRKRSWGFTTSSAWRSATSPRSCCGRRCSAPSSPSAAA